MSQFFNNETRRILVDHLINRGHDTKLHQLFNDNARFDRHLLCELANADIFGQLDVVNDSLSRLFKSMLIRLIARATTLSATCTTNARLSGLNSTERQIMTALLASSRRHIRAI